MKENCLRSIPCNFRVTLKQKEWLAKRRRRQSDFVRKYLSEHPNFEIRNDPENVKYALVELHLYAEERKLIISYGSNASKTIRSLLYDAMADKGYKK